jgi:hypothetical protein
MLCLGGPPCISLKPHQPALESSGFALVSTFIRRSECLKGVDFETLPACRHDPHPANLAQVPPADLDAPVVSQLAAPEFSLGNALEPGPLEVVGASRGRSCGPRSKARFFGASGHFIEKRQLERRLFATYRKQFSSAHDKPTRVGKEVVSHQRIISRFALDSSQSQNSGPFGALARTIAGADARSSAEQVYVDCMAARGWKER